MLKIAWGFSCWIDVSQTVFPSLTLRDWRTESRYQSVMIPGIQSSISRFRTSWRGWDGWLGGGWGVWVNLWKHPLGMANVRRSVVSAAAIHQLRLSDCSIGVPTFYVLFCLMPLQSLSSLDLRYLDRKQMLLYKLRRWEQGWDRFRKLLDAFGIYLPRMIKIAWGFSCWIDVTQTVFPSLTLRDWRTESRYQSVMIPGIQSSISRFRTSWRGWEWLGGRRVGCLGQFMETSVGHGQCTKKCCECCCYTPTSALRLFDWSSNLLRPFLFDAIAIFIISGPQVLRPQTDAAVQVEEVGAGLRQIPEAFGIICREC